MYAKEIDFAAAGEKHKQLYLPNRLDLSSPLISSETDRESKGSL